MKIFYINCTNVPANADRALFVTIFKPFGDITKIYLPPNLNFCKVYFASKESAEQALCLSGQPPHYLNIVLATEDQQNKNKGKSAAPSSSEANNSSMSINENDEELYGEPGPNYYNMHGVCVPTLIGDDGTLYVSVDDVKKVGFQLFEERNVPKNINFDKRKLDELRVYLMTKARKYLQNMRCTLTENEIERASNDTINEYINNGLIQDVSRRDNFNMSGTFSKNDSVKPRQSNGSDFRNKSNNKGFFGRNNKPQQNQVEQQKPLRRPMDNVKDDKPQKQYNNNRLVNSSNITNDSLNSSNHSLEKINLKEEIETSTPKQPTIQYIELPLNKPVQVTVSFVNSDEKCWVQRQSDQKKLGNLLFEVNMAGTKSPVIQPCIGQLCAATYLGAWYRAVVEEVTPSIKVRYIDFGNVNDEVVKETRELASSALNEPGLAVQIVFNTKPKEKLVDGAELKVIVTKKNKDGSYAVEEIGKEERTIPSPLEVVPAGKVIKAPLVDTNEVKQPTTNRDFEKGLSPSRTASPQNERTRSDSVQSSGSAKTDKSTSSHLTLKEKLRKMSESKKETKSLNPTSRKSVVDVFEADQGMIEWIRRLDDGSSLVCVFSQKFMADMELLEQIADEKTPNFTCNVGDTVSVLKDGSWVRGIILNVENNQYTVAYIDYGEIVVTDKVGKLEKRFFDVPEFICICSANTECLNLLEKNTTAEYTSTENNKMQVTLDNVVYNVTCSRWDPFLTFKPTSDAKQTASNPVFTTVPPLKQVVDGKRVLPVVLNEDKLLVRSEETHKLLKKINEEIQAYKASPLTQKPVLQQLVLCPHDTQTLLCRGIVRSLNNSYVDIEFIDYGFVDTVPTKNLMDISESLATEHCCLIPVILKDFEDGAFSTEAIEHIESLCKSAQKLTAKKSGGNTFDLLLGTEPNQVSLSSELKRLSASNNVLRYKDMDKWTIANGTTENLLCVSIEDDGTIGFLATEEETQMKFAELTDKIAEYVEKNTDPYSPVVDEVCLAKHVEGDYYRAMVQEVNPALEQYRVYYIDFGNVGTVNSSDIRIIPPEFVQIPALAVLCRLTEMAGKPYTPKIVEKIKDNVMLGGSYDVTVIQRTSDNIHEVNMPALSGLL